MQPLENRHIDFARQLEHVVTVASLSGKLAALESQFCAARGWNKSAWAAIQRRLLIAKRVTLAAALAASFFQLYYLDVQAQILAMRPVGVATHIGA